MGLPKSLTGFFGWKRLSECGEGSVVLSLPFRNAWLVMEIMHFDERTDEVVCEVLEASEGAHRFPGDCVRLLYSSMVRPLNEMEAIAVCAARDGS